MVMNSSSAMAKLVETSSKLARLERSNEALVDHLLGLSSVAMRSTASSRLMWRASRSSVVILSKWREEIGVVLAREADSRRRTHIPGVAGC